MKKLIKYTALASIFCASGFYASSAIALEMPPLERVMQENIIKQKQAKQQPSQIPKIEKPKIEKEEQEDLPRIFSYTKIKKDGNIKIYKAREAEIFIQEIKLIGKTHIKSLLTKPISWNKDINEGEPEFERKNMKGFLKLAQGNPTSIINGQFFNGNTNPTTLSFGLKSDGEIKSVGADNRGRQKKILTIINRHIKTLPYSWENFSKKTGAFALVGFDFNIPNRSKSRVGRNYLCPKNVNARNTSHTLVSLFGQEMTDEEGLQELKKYGCKKENIIKLDGGGSARFWHKNTALFGFSKDKPDYRTIPHMIGFYEK
ncbi:hypothetical protein CSB09_03930 [Candidatus Gracilibacteria bacterium]|nr:MAG: hypothetical protein CSB09_03930 [Candidatus Gracilibacteria bacterium]